MACEIKLGGREVSLNNKQFSRLIDFGLEVTGRTASADEQPFVARMRYLDDNVFWPGRGIDTEVDFPNLAERKFWCRVFFDTSRAIVDRTVGRHWPAPRESVQVV